MSFDIVWHCVGAHVLLSIDCPGNHVVVMSARWEALCARHTDYLKPQVTNFTYSW